MSEECEEGTYWPDEEGLSRQALVLLLAVLLVSPPVLFSVLVFIVNDEGMLAYCGLVIAIEMVFLSIVYLGEVRDVRRNTAITRGARLFLFCDYLIAAAFLFLWAYDRSRDPLDSHDEFLQAFAERVFLIVHPLNALLVLALTVASATFRRVSKDLVIEMVLGFLLLFMFGADIFLAFAYA